MSCGAPLAAEHPKAAEYLAALVAADLSFGNSYDVLVNGDKVFPAMLEAIDRARKRISFERRDRWPISSPPSSRRQPVAACRSTMSSSISIGASKMDKEHVERLRDAGCKVVDFNPSHWYALEDLNYRTHRKILVVDGEIDRYGQCHDRLGKSGRVASGASAMTPIGPAACRVNDLGEAGGYALVDQAMICETAINCTIGSAIGGSLTSLVKSTR